jgi:AAA domain
MSENQGGGASELRLDDKTVEARTEGYPDEAREAARWVAGFIRDKCNRQISTLLGKCKTLGHVLDYSYWHKIVCGKYFGPDPTRPGKVAGSVANFLQVVNALREADIQERRSGRPPFIETPTWELINNFITKKRMPGRVNKFGGIVGATGTQKSACLIEYQMRNNHGMVVHVEAPETPRMSQFVTDLAVAYGENRSVNTARKTAAISLAVKANKCIIVDNVQRLYNDKRGGNQPIFNFLQKLQDDTDCTIIFSYTPDFTRILENGMDRGYFEQFVGRMGGLGKALVLPEFAPAEDLQVVAEAYGLKDAGKHVKYLDKLARQPGRIRAFFEDMQDAKAEAEGKPLTIAHLKMVRGEEEA